MVRLLSGAGSPTPELSPSSSRFVDQLRSAINRRTDTGVTPFVGCGSGCLGVLISVASVSIDVAGATGDLVEGSLSLLAKIAGDAASGGLDATLQVVETAGEVIVVHRGTLDAAVRVAPGLEHGHFLKLELGRIFQDQALVRIATETTRHARSNGARRQTRDRWRP